MSVSFALLSKQHFNAAPNYLSSPLLANPDSRHSIAIFWFIRDLNPKLTLSKLAMGALILVSMFFLKITVP